MRVSRKFTESYRLRTSLAIDATQIGAAFLMNIVCSSSSVLSGLSGLSKHSEVTQAMISLRQSMIRSAPALQVPGRLGKSEKSSTSDN